MAALLGSASSSAFILKNVVSEAKRARAEELSLCALDQLAQGDALGAIENFRSAIADDPGNFDAHHGLVRALRDAGRLEQSIGAALALTALTPDDPLAHTALSISLQQAGHIPEAEAAAARARVLEWKAQLRSSAPDDKP
jgi:Flp pilus assembly protein TadD